MPFSKKISIKIVTAVFFGAFPFLIGQIAFAEEKTCDKQIEEKLNDLLSIKDDLKLSEDKKSDLEFEAKKDLLFSVLSCSKKELEDVKKDLLDLKKISDEDNQIKEALLKKIDNFFSFFDDKNATFEEIKKDKEKIKELAKEILEWRQNTYSPLIKEAVNFSFFYKQENIISIAEARYEKISSSLKKILSVKNKEVDDLLLSSNKKIKEAKDLNSEAFVLIKKDAIPFLLEFSSLATTTSEKIENLSFASSTPEKSSKENKGVEKDVKIEEKKTPEKLIKDSLDKIKDAYRDFFKISKAVEKLLKF